MIKKLKFKLIAVCLLAVSIVLTLIVTASYFATMLNITIETDKTIKLINNKANELIANPSSSDSDFANKTKELHYFVYKDFNESDRKDYYFSKDLNLSKERVEYFINRANRQRLFNRGYINGFRFHRIDIIENDEVIGKTIIFVNCNRQIFYMRFMLVSAIIISLISLFTIFSLLQLFANKILKPIIDAHEKQKKFITNASHELKTPLTVITANNELLEMEYGENEYTQTISKQIVKLTTMTNTLVSLSKIDEMNTLEDMYEFSVTDAAYDIIQTYKKVLEKEFTYEIDENVTLLGNEKLIRDLITLILDNARKYSESYIKFSINKTKGKIHLVCENDTSNIEKGNLNHYAERFFRSDEIRGNVSSGSGIGLSLVKEIVEIHRGIMKIYSPDGKTYIININF